MIQFFVQARKDGYKVLYPNPTPPEFFKFAGDLRPESTNPYILGKSLYTIALSSDGCIFTKHIIIQDVQRQGLGNVSFSILIPHSRKLSGNHAVTLLDELVETYCTRYCPDFYLGKIHEDWEIFTDITDRYSLSYNPDFDIKTVGTDLTKTAFIYYSDQEELKKYFDSPYQEKYLDFKQVFFVDGNLKDKPDNPLNALTGLNADNLTGKIDLENPLYKLEGFSSTGKNGVTIEIWANGSRCSNNSRIRRKDMVRIRYTKNDTYFIPIEVTGFIYDNTVAPYLSVHGNKITVKNDVQLESKKKELRLSITDEQDKPVTDASIVCKDKLTGIDKPVRNDIVCFEGEELGKTWTIWAEKSNLKTKPFNFIPLNTPSPIRLGLVEYKNVKFTVLDEETRKIIYNFNLYIENERQYGYSEFYGDDIKKILKVSIACSGYETKNFNFCPAKDDAIFILRHKKPVKSEKQQYYIINIDKKKGKYTEHGKKIEQYVTRIPDCCDPKFGYKFKKWEYNEPKAFSTCTALFEELWWHKILKKVWFPVILVIIITSVSVKHCDSGNKQSRDKQTEQRKKQIEAVLKKNSTNCDSLQYYNNVWVDQKPEIETKGKFKFLGHSFGTEKPDSSQYKEWELFHKKIQEAIKECKEENSSKPPNDGGQTQEKNGNRSINQGQTTEQKKDQGSSSQTSLTKKKNEIQEKYKKQFWELVGEQKVTKNNFDTLFIRYLEESTNAQLQNPKRWEYYEFYDKYLSVKVGPKLRNGQCYYEKGFGNIPVKLRTEVAKNLKTLELLINEYRINN